MKFNKKTIHYLKYCVLFMLVFVAGTIYFFTVKEKNIHSGDTYSVENNKEKQDIAVQTDNDNKIYVYVCGEIMNPGVLACKEGSRIYEVIELAGGVTDLADLNSLNLADTVKDEQKIFVPSKNESVDINSGDGYAGYDNTKVNINLATVEQLTTLPGIGESRAKDIIAYRNEFGYFGNIEDIMKISGIKESVYLKIKDLITV